MGSNEDHSDRPSHEDERVPVPVAFKSKTHIPSREKYDSMWRQSVDDPSTFWGLIADEFYWEKKWAGADGVMHANFDVRKGPIVIEWYKGGKTNLCYNCIDRHVEAGEGNKVAIFWEGYDPSHEARFTYKQLQSEISKVANYLRSKGVRKGDFVGLYMPMVAQLPIAMLACARIGAVHNVIYAGLSASSTARCLADCQTKLLITCTAVKKGNELLQLKAIADEALELAESRHGLHIANCLIYDNSHACARSEVNFKQGRDAWWQDEVEGLPEVCPVEWMDGEDPLFVLYSSGSTGKPKGLLYTTGGYMVYSATTAKYSHDLYPEDVYWSTSDIGWATGHTYLVYGAFLNRASVIVYEGVSTWDHPGRAWEIVDKYKVTIFFTGPTILRSLKAFGNQDVARYSRASLRLLGTTGEAIDSTTWHWYFNVIGDGRCPILNTWGQTETGGNVLSPIPGAADLKPGAVSLPLFGIELAILNTEGEEQEGPCEGHLCIKRPWPGIARTIYGDDTKFQKAYFEVFRGYYTTGDGCRRDKDGFIWITGRMDDTITVAGFSANSEELEAALDSHPACAEAAVVGVDDEMKGQAIHAFVVLAPGFGPTEGLKEELNAIVIKEYNPDAALDAVHWAPGLPKTRNGKIPRRILRKIAAQDVDDLGDTSSLADMSIVDALIKSIRRERDYRSCFHEPRNLLRQLPRF